MAVLAGIDEAGYGPILGPLVVTCTVFSLPDELLRSNLWHVLRQSVAKRRRKLAGRMLIADSKKAYSRSAGIGQLERTVLAGLRCLGKAPTSAGEMMQILCPDCIGRLARYPWYQQLGAKPLGGNSDDIAIAAKALRRNLSATNAKLICIRSLCLDVAYYNQMVGAVRNKASVLFSAVCQLVKEAFDNSGSDSVQVIIDRQSGRRRYAAPLLRMLPGMELTVLREGATDSSYELSADQKKMRLHFALDADERFLPVSLASMVSKYVREIMVESINRYFAHFCADLRPTAGYWKDGLRFIDDLHRHKPHVQYDRNQLIRSR